MPIAKPIPRMVEKMLAKRARERAAIDARAEVRRRDHGKCRCCGKPGSEVHHLKYRSQGGKDDPSNTVLLCLSCHRAVHGHALAVSGHDATSVRFEWDARLKKRTA